MSDQEITKTYGLTASPLNQRLIGALREKGFEVLIFPAAKTAAAELSDRALEIIREPGQFEWIIFSDVFAADYFIEAMREQETDFFELDDLTIGALGEAVADRLRFVQIHADVIPPNVSDETAFSAIKQYAGGDLKNVRLLLVGGDSKINGLAELLRGAHSEVEELKIYHTGFGVETQTAKLKTLLKGGAIDEFIFSSAEEVAGLKSFFETNDLGGILNEIKAFATSEVAFQTLQENGLRPLYFHL